MTDQQPPGGVNAGQSADKPQCTAQTQLGRQCRAFALPGGDLCNWHEPARSERVHAARSKGGRMTAIRSRRPRLNTAAALIRFNGNLLQDVLEGITQGDLARAVFYGLSVQCRLVELHQAADLEKRLERLEAAIQQQPQQHQKVRAWGG